MKYTNASWIVVWVFVALWSFPSLGAVPQSINYQGQLSSAGGGPINDTVDLVFSICADSLCLNSLWSESHIGVIVKDGLFEVRLGSSNPVPGSVFDGSMRWLTISLNRISISKPLPMISVAYAYRSITSDTANFVKNGSGIDCSNCNAVFVNVAGPDSVYATMGTALLGKAKGSSSDDLTGIGGHASNAGGGLAYGGFFATSDSGTGAHYAVRADGNGASAATTCGVWGQGINTSTGMALGGFFATAPSGTGVHCALRSDAYASSSSASYGILSGASNYSSGQVYGGSFLAGDNGTGDHYGVYAYSEASAANSYGVWGEARNSGGHTYGGYFVANFSGEGNHYGVKSEAHNASGGYAYGVHATAENTADGNAIGGYFEVSGHGSGDLTGVEGTCYAFSSTATAGVRGDAQNSGSGLVCGGSFSAGYTGTGTPMGVSTQAATMSAKPAYGLYDIAYTYSSGDAYAGYFRVIPTVVGTGQRYGIYAEATTAGWFKGKVNCEGNLDVVGNLAVSGSKSAAVKTDNGDYRLMYSQESPENWFEDFGEGQLVNGRAHIDLDPLFLQTVTIDAQHPMKVFIQPNDENCKGTAVKRGTSGFDVIELENGTGNASFTYRVVAKRRGFESVRLAKMGGRSPEELSAKSASMSANMETERAKMEEEHQRRNTKKQASEK